MKQTPVIYMCRDCVEFVKQSGIKRHLSSKHGYRGISQMHDEYVRGITNIYFIIPIQAYRIKDRSLMLLLKKQ